MEQRLINADEAVANIRETFIGASDFARDTREAACDAVRACATIDPVKHGRWVRKVDMDELINTCSECYYPVSLWHKTNFCPSCGCRMDGEE